jgi:hypothetical protein
MNKGDLVFYKDKLAAKARISAPQGDGIFYTSLPLGNAEFRLIFQYDGVQHWALECFGETTLEDVIRDGWVIPYERNPSASPEGMVAAIDLILGEVGKQGHSTVRQYLTAMRGFFVLRLERGVE